MPATTEEYTEVRCTGCKVLMGVGNGPPMHKVWCTPVCAADFPVSDNEERDSIIEALARLNAWTPTRIAVNFDMSRARALQVLKERLVR